MRDDATDVSPHDAGQPAPEDALRWYIDKYESAYGHSTIPFSDQLRRVMSPASRLRAKVLATDLQSARARRRAAGLAARPGPVRLHLGCGWNHLEGWINSDLVGAAGDFAWNLHRPLPFPDGTVDVIFLEHVFEHMPYSATLAVLGHCRRALRPGGVLRVGVPDGGMYARMYVERPEQLRLLRWGRATPMLALREVFQEHAHVAAYDAETLLLVLKVAGFPGAAITPGGTSELLSEVPDMPERIPETVYAEVLR